ncbi:hypothetical protein FOA52_016246 [Chlamydomonas sp. UWO 241]|nr:hypothetical protein FOA52_016246 [Chlamydomonas sp. UWO 241]
MLRLSHGDLRKLKRKLAGALKVLAANTETDETAVMIAAAGAIPPLVKMLKLPSEYHGPADPVPVTSGQMQQTAAAALLVLARTAENAVAIVAAGAIPLLVQLSRSDADADTQAAAADALEAIRSGVAKNRAAIAAAKASADIVHKMERLGVGNPSDVQTP